MKGFFTACISFVGPFIDAHRATWVMTNESIPIACTLNDAEFREREQVVLQKIKASVLAAEEIGSGYSFRFPPDDAVFAALNEFIVLERRCCPFLDFKVTVPHGEGDIILELSGPHGAKDSLRRRFYAGYGVCH